MSFISGEHDDEDTVLPYAEFLSVPVMCSLLSIVDAVSDLCVGMCVSDLCVSDGKGDIIRCTQGVREGACLFRGGRGGAYRAIRGEYVLYLLGALPRALP